MPNSVPVESGDFLGNRGALLQNFFGIWGANCRHSRGASSYMFLYKKPVVVTYVFVEMCKPEIRARLRLGENPVRRNSPRCSRLGLVHRIVVAVNNQSASDPNALRQLGLGFDFTGTLLIADSTIGLQKLVSGSPVQLTSRTRGGRGRREGSARRAVQRCPHQWSGIPPVISTLPILATPASAASTQPAQSRVAPEPRLLTLTLSGGRQLRSWPRVLSPQTLN